MRVINQGWNSDFLNSIFWFFTCFGLGWVQVLLILPLLLKPVLRITAWGGLIGFASSGILVQIVKRIAPRLRPGNWPETIQMPDEQLRASSFASGHTATAFGIATAITLLLPLESRLKAGLFLYSVALMVGLSRIYRGVHWPTDVLGGAMLGIACGCLVAHFLNRKKL